MRITKSLETKLSIYRAAVELLEEEDIDAISIRAIAKRAKISVGTFYYYFSTKYEVFGYAHTLMGVYLTSTVEKNLPNDTTWNRMMFLFEQYHNFIVYRTPKKLHQALCRLDPVVSQRGQNETGLDRILMRIIEDGKERGEVTSNESSSEICNILLTCIRGFYRQWAINANEMQTDAIINKYIPMMVEIFVQRTTS